MSRTAQSNLQSLEPRVLSMDTATHIALADAGGETAAIAEAVELEVSATSGADGVEECAAARAAPEPLALTCAADLRVGWGELQEWLARS
ncbi:MAG: hypothetical protein ACREVS_18800 [Burkholderiales bacterium]